MGCESALQRRIVSTKSDFKIFAISCLENSGSYCLPYVRAAYQHSKSISKLCSLDRMYTASHSNHVAMRASIQMGRSLIHSSVSAFQHSHLRCIQNAIECDEMEGHQDIVFGSVCATMNISMDKTLLMYMFNALRTIMTSMVRLGKVVGSMEAQLIQFELQRLIPDIIERNREKSEVDASMKFPLVDVIQNAHDMLFNRMFYS